MCFSDNTKRKRTFRSLVLLQFMMYLCTGILPVNIGNLLTYLPKTTKFGIGVATAGTLIMGIISILTFGYYCDKISEKFSRKKIFIYTNFIWILAFGLSSLAPNYFFYLGFLITSAIGTGAFLPIGYSMIGDLFSPDVRGRKYGVMQFSLVLGVGMGIIFGGIFGRYLGHFGWRYAYGFGFILSSLTLIFYIISAVEPERLRSEPEFENFKGIIKYNYKITFANLKELFSKKSLASILFSVLCAGIANATLAIWAIFYLNTKITGTDSDLLATTIYVLAGSGSLPGTIIGGKLGDRYFNTGRLKGRALISILGLVSGILFIMAFYLLPFSSETTVQTVLSWIFFLFVGYFGFFLTAFPVGNQFAIYSEVSLPEVRSTANAMNGLMVNIGGIIGNLLISSLIERNISLLPIAIFLVLIIWLGGALFWIFPYFYYPKEAKECREILISRRKELDTTSK